MTDGPIGALVTKSLLLVVKRASYIGRTVCTAQCNLKNRFDARNRENKNRNKNINGIFEIRRSRALK